MYLWTCLHAKSGNSHGLERFAANDKTLVMSCWMSAQVSKREHAELCTSIDAIRMMFTHTGSPQHSTIAVHIDARVNIVSKVHAHECM